MSWWSRLRGKRSFEAVKEHQQASGASDTEAEQVATEVAVTEQARTPEADEQSSEKALEKDLNGLSKAELYEEATKRGIAGRSSMSKAELLKALSS